jgi:hypothetical protein
VFTDLRDVLGADRQTLGESTGGGEIGPAKSPPRQLDEKRPIRRCAKLPYKLPGLFARERVLRGDEASVAPIAAAGDHFAFVHQPIVGAGMQQHLLRDGDESLTTCAGAVAAMAAKRKYRSMSVSFYSTALQHGATAFWDRRHHEARGTLAENVQRALRRSGACSSTAINCLSRRVPNRRRVFTVPMGQPSSVAISVACLSEK